VEKSENFFHLPSFPFHRVKTLSNGLAQGYSIMFAAVSLEITNTQES
jgi:hypothetical protein